MKRIVIRFGSIAVALIALLQLGKYTFFLPDLRIELWIGLFAVLFGSMGFVLSRHVMKPVAVHIDRPSEIDVAKIQELRITDREYEVLQNVALGLSNKEIADQLFLSESTIKTHVSSLLGKLDAKRRTQAVTRAKELRIIA